MFSKMLKTGLLGTALALTMGAMAQAAPLPPATTVGQNLIAGGTSISASFLFADAGDDSDLDVTVNLGAASFLFSNSGAVTNNATAVGTTTSFGAAIGDLLTFTLNDKSVVNSWATGVGSTNVAYLASSDVATIEAALGVDLNAAAEAALAGLAVIGPVVVVAFEDRPLDASDKDFNDLIFAFAPIFAESVPEPMTLGLLGAGLLGLGAAARRRKAA